jgi:hypothetical protein
MQSTGREKKNIGEKVEKNKSEIPKYWTTEMSPQKTHPHFP